jgi:hypothetical protein
MKLCAVYLSTTSTILTDNSHFRIPVDLHHRVSRLLMRMDKVNSCWNMLSLGPMQTPLLTVHQHMQVLLPATNNLALAYSHVPKALCAQ